MQRASHAETVNKIVVSANGSMVAAASRGFPIHLYTADKLQHVGKITPPADSSFDIGLSHDGAMLAASTTDGLFFQNVSTGEVVTRYATTKPIAFSDDGRWSLTREKVPGKDGLLINMTTGKIKHRVEDAHGVGFSSDEKHFVIVRTWRENSKAKEV